MLHGSTLIADFSAAQKALTQPVRHALSYSGFGTRSAVVVPRGFARALSRSGGLSEKNRIGELSASSLCKIYFDFNTGGLKCQAKRLFLNKFEDCKFNCRTFGSVNLSEHWSSLSQFPRGGIEVFAKCYAAATSLAVLYPSILRG